jgi:hypothetical protein
MAKSNINITKLIEEQPMKNKWIKYDHMNVYLRVQPKSFLGRAIIPCITIASAGMPLRYQRQGRFSALLAKLRQESQLCIYVENVHNVEFKHALLRGPFYPAEYAFGDVIGVVELRGAHANLIAELQAYDLAHATSQPELVQHEGTKH